MINGIMNILAQSLRLNLGHRESFSRIMNQNILHQHRNNFKCSVFQGLSQTLDIHNVKYIETL